MHAGVEPPGLSRVEGDAPHVGSRQSLVARLPRLSAILRDQDADAPSAGREARGRAGIEGNVVKVAIDAGAPEIFEALAAIAGDKDAAALGHGEPKARIVRRLLDVHHLKSG